MSSYSPTELEAFVRSRAPEIANEIRNAADQSGNEADLVAATERILERFADNFDITLRLQRERTLINGRADAVYNRFVIEYEPPRSLRKELTFRHNQHAIGQGRTLCLQFIKLIPIDIYYYELHRSASRPPCIEAYKDSRIR